MLDRIFSEKCGNRYFKMLSAAVLIGTLRVDLLCGLCISDKKKKKSEMNKIEQKKKKVNFFFV